MADDNFGAIMVPGPRPLWHILAMVVGGLVVVGGGFYVWHRNETHPTPAKVAAAKRAHKKGTKTASVESTTPPTNYVTASPKGVSVFTQMAAINNKYIAWADQEIHAQVPQIPATGPNAGALTPAILNNPAVMTKWGGSAVPMSLAGIALPPGTPSNGSIVGMTPQELQMVWEFSMKRWPTLTLAETQSAITTAADFVMEINSSNPASALQYEDPYSDGGGADQSLLDNAANPNYPIIQYFTASKANGGMLSWRQVEYESWVSLSLNPQDFFSGSTQFSQYDPVTTTPAGHVLIGNLAVQDFSFHTVESGLVDGHLTVGRYDAPIGTVSLALIHSGGQARWYVTGLSGDVFGNTPSQTYWTAPSSTS